jgi:ribosomal protein S18 acetylase RimI-like enzyme
MPAIEPLEQRDLRVARQIHAVLKLARAQEAQWLGLSEHAPGEPTPESIQASGVFYLGAYCGSELAGAASVGPDDEADQLCISSLAVHPQFLRQGLGSALVREALRRGPGMVFSVSVAASNLPALALYRALGFVAYRQGRLGTEDLAMLKLRRVAGDAASLH